MPIGAPLLSKPHGTDSAGMPSVLNGRVRPVKPATIFSTAGPPLVSVSVSSIVGSGKGIAGSSTAST